MGVPNRSLRVIFPQNEELHFRSEINKVLLTATDKRISFS